MYTLFFRFDASHKKLFVSCHYHILFVCQAVMVFKVNTAYFWVLRNIPYFSVLSEIQIKYIWQSIISLLKYSAQDPRYTAVLTTVFFFHAYSYQVYGLFFRFAGS